MDIIDNLLYKMATVLPKKLFVFMLPCVFFIFTIYLLKILGRIF